MRQHRSYDFRNKTVGVIGGGSSSIQIIPELQKLDGIKLSTFVRSKVWISNRFGDHGMAALGLRTDELECKFLVSSTAALGLTSNDSLRGENPEVQG
jgi:cation diffusion facilitator CzcD-associated flavoprotein CzcO